MSYDSKCFDLAEFFLMEEHLGTEQEMHALAQAIQDTIEDGIKTIKALRQKSREQNVVSFTRRAAPLLILALFVIPACRADQANCFTLLPGESIITSLPPCPVTELPPPVYVPADLNDADDQGEDEGNAFIVAVNDPVSTPEPSTLALALLGLAGLYFTRRRHELS
jgi:hypothetical protein